jgi:hypothetical protein
VSDSYLRAFPLSNTQELYENPGPIQLSGLCAQEGCLNAVA